MNKPFHEFLVPSPLVPYIYNLKKGGVLYIILGLQSIQYVTPIIVTNGESHANLILKGPDNTNMTNNYVFHGPSPSHDAL